MTPTKTARFPEARTAVITGAVSPTGIGRATANYLAARGWNIGIIDIDEGASQAVAAEISERHAVHAFGAGADMRDEAAVRSAFDRIEAALPQLVALANVAGVSSPVPYLELDAAEWDRVLGINLNGVHYASHRAAESMVRNRLGRIVNISSVSAQRGGGTYSRTPYSTAKAGVIGLTRATARELGEFDITVNAIAPGPIDTEIMGGALTEERKASMVSDLVLERIGTVDDIASAIAFLFSEESGFITGHTLNVDGGLYMN